MNQELLYKYFKGITSVEEEKMILDWIDASDENRDIFLKERMIYDISLFSDKQGNNEKKTVHIMPMLRWAARIAAVTIVAIAGYFITSDFLYNKEVQLQTVTVPAGQRAQIILADGTRVWLNSKSTMKYAANFGRNERNVELDGEAYFEVAKNKNIPFYVHTETNKVKVVGTSFNVCAYSGSHEFGTTLVEGIVDIYPANSCRKTRYFSMKTENVERPSFLPMNIYAGKRDYTVLTTLHSAVSSVDWRNTIM